MYSVLPDVLKPLDVLADELMQHPVASRAMDQRVHAALEREPLAEPPCYTGDLDAALALIPHGWWWSLSHLRAQIIPNRPEPGIPVSNATDYYFTGRPVGYEADAWGQREALPSAVCAAMVRAYLALKTKAAAMRDDRCYMIQTGQGPMLVTRAGRLREVPAQSWLNEAGVLIARKDVFPPYEFQEPPPEDDED